MFLQQAKSLQKDTILLILLPVALCFSRAALEAIILLLMLSFFYQSYKRSEWGWARTGYVYLFCLVALCLILVSLFAEVSVGSSMKRSLLWIRHPIILIAIAFCFISTYREKRNFLIGVTFFLGVIVVDCYIQNFTGFSMIGNPTHGERLTSFLDRPNIGSYLLRITLPLIAMNFYLYHHNEIGTKLFKTLNLLLFCGALPVVFLTGERMSSILLLLVLVLLFIALMALKKKSRMIILIVACAFIALISIVFVFDPFINKRMLMMIEDISNFSSSLYGSLFYAAYYLWQTKGVFFGVGLKNFREACPELIDSNIVTYCDLHPHNFYLEWLSEAGLLGFCLFCIMGFLFIKNSFLLYVRLLKVKANINLIMASFFCFCTFMVNFFPFAATMSFFSNWNAALIWFSLAIAFLVNQEMLRNFRQEL